MATDKGVHMLAWYQANPPPPGDPWAPFLAPFPAGWANRLSAALAPGRVIVDPFSRTDVVPREGVRAGHSVLALGALPVYPLVLRLHLRPPLAQHVEALWHQWGGCALTSGTLRNRVREAFAVTCGQCGEVTQADYYLWRRGEEHPVAAGYRCHSCGAATERPLYGDEVVLMTSREERPGHFWYLVRRVIPVDDPLADRVAQMLDFYTPRQQALFAAMIQCLERLDLDVEEHHVGLGLVLAALWAGLPLWSRPLPEAWPERWRRPNPYVEHNPWYLAERAVEFLTRLRVPLIPWSYHLARWLESREERASVLVLASPAQQVAAHLPARSVGLLATAPLPPVGPLLGFSALWTGLLFGPRAAEPFRALLSAQRTNWRLTLHSLTRTFTPWRQGPASDATWALDFSGLSSPAWLMWHLLLSGHGGTLTGHAVMLDPNQGPALRAQWRWDQPPRRQLVDQEPDVARLTESAVHAVVDAISERGEPLWDSDIWPFVFARWDQEGLLVSSLLQQRGLDAQVRSAVEAALQQAPDLRVLGTPGRRERLAYWLYQEPRVVPLSDRVELTVWRLLRRGGEEWTEAALWHALVERCSGWLTPAPSLVEACLAAYAYTEAGRLRLRPEESPARRRAELAYLARGLTAVGQRLGYRPSGARWVQALCDVPSLMGIGERFFPFHLVWQRDGQGYAFAFTLFGLLRFWLNRAAVPEGITPCLVFPGSRAGLVAWRLRANPWWRLQVQQGRWAFLRFHRLRWVLSLGDDLDEQAWHQALGLADTDFQPGLLV